MTMWFYSGVHHHLRFPQWTSPFTVDLVEYNYAEQLVMASQARLFGDDTAFSATLASDYPREHKRLGRQLRHFDPALWCKTNEMLSSFEAISHNSLKTKRHVLP